jgi:hypothetical protein
VPPVPCAAMEPCPRLAPQAQQPAAAHLGEVSGTTCTHTHTHIPQDHFIKALNRAHPECDVRPPVLLLLLIAWHSLVILPVSTRTHIHIHTHATTCAQGTVQHKKRNLP